MPKHCFSCVFWHKVDPEDTKGICDVLPDALSCIAIVQMPDTWAQLDEATSDPQDPGEAVNLPVSWILTPEKFGCPAHMWRDPATQRRSNAAKLSHVDRAIRTQRRRAKWAKEAEEKEPTP